MGDQDQTHEAADTDKTKEQAVMAEQLAELQKKLDAITATQSGSDRKVQELTAALTAAKAEKETVAKTDAERIAELEHKADAAESAAARERLRTYARSLLDDASIKPPRYFDRLIGNDEEETKKWVLDFVEEEKERTAERNQQHDSSNGRVVTGPEKKLPDTWEALSQMSEEELTRLGATEVARLTRLARDKA